MNFLRKNRRPVLSGRRFLLQSDSLLATPLERRLDYYTTNNIASCNV